MQCITNSTLLPEAAVFINVMRYNMYLNFCSHNFFIHVYTFELYGHIYCHYNILQEAICFLLVNNIVYKQICMTNLIGLQKFTLLHNFVT